MIVVPFENWHLEFIKPEYPIFRDGINWEHQAVAFTLYEDGHYYAIFGAVPLWPGNYETFLFTDKEKFKNRKLQCIKIFKQQEKFLVDNFKPRRAQTTVPVRHCAWQRWLEFQGYVNEGIMRCFGPDGQDHYRYAKVY
jgi:hypothetical protein|tara:strand:- start:107 stop:520 length:414 start_codon:yes stop_codon:yes gene_type:complete